MCFESGLFQIVRFVNGGTDDDYRFRYSFCRREIQVQRFGVDSRRRNEKKEVGRVTERGYSVNCTSLERDTLLER